MIRESIQCLQVPDKIFYSSIQKNGVSRFDMIYSNICNNKIMLRLRSIQRNFRFKFETFESK